MGGLTLAKRISTAFKVLRGTAAEDWNAFYGTPSMRSLTKAGTRINEQSALTISALYAALNFLCGVVASLPLRVYRTLPTGGKERATNHPLYERLHVKPNSTPLTAWQWIYTSLMHKYLWGNWWTLATQPNMELTPLLPDRTWIDVRWPDIVFTKDNQGQRIPLDRRDVLLIPHVSLGGVMGKGIIHYAWESLGLIKAQEEFAASYFGSGIKAGGFVEAEHAIAEETRTGLQKDFNEKYSQLGQAWKAIFLTGGAKWKPNELDAQKAQALESRQFSIAEVSRWTGLSPHLLHDLSRATFSNIEELDLALVTFTLTPIVTQVEQAINVTWLTDRDRATGHYTKFDLKGLLRGNLQARTAFYTAMLDRGVYHADDVLELEDQNPQPNGLGKIYFMPLNFVNKENAINPESLAIEAPRSMRIIETPAPRQITETRSMALRRKITQAYKKQFDAYGQRIVNKEVKRLREIAAEAFSERDAGTFLDMSDRFYLEFSKRVDQTAAPLLASYAESILPIALEEIKSEAEIDPQYQQFLAQYREYFVRRHVESSQAQLREIIQQAQGEELDPAELLEQRFVEWEEKRPAKIAMRESLRAENAFARQVFLLCGVSKIMSVAFGKNCPYCSSLDGTVIGIDQNFLSKGDFQPEGADAPLTVTSNHSHPPYHDGCDCGIVVA